MDAIIPSKNSHDREERLRRRRECERAHCMAETAKQVAKVEAAARLGKM